MSDDRATGRKRDGEMRRKNCAAKRKNETRTRHSKLDSRIGVKKEHF